MAPCTLQHGSLRSILAQNPADLKTLDFIVEAATSGRGSEVEPETDSGRQEYEGEQVQEQVHLPPPGMKLNPQPVNRCWMIVVIVYQAAQCACFAPSWTRGVQPKQR